MKTFVSLFVSSLVFSAAIATVYWFTAYDPTGTFFLGIMAASFAFVVAYILIAEREANFASDRPNAEHADAAGEYLGLFQVESAWPIVLAAAVVSLLVGMLLPWLAVAGTALLLVTIWMLVRESR